MQSVRARRLLCGGIAAMLIVGGYIDLWFGGTDVASTMLTTGYLLAMPMALWACLAFGDGTDVEPETRTSGGEERPPYALAALVSLSVSGLYLLTLAPTIGLWDASEYIAVARVLGIPHAPGNPLFVLIAHTFGLLPLPGSYAARINLLSATASALAAGVWAMVMYRLLRSWMLPVPARYAVSTLASLLSATTFTLWNQSVVSEKVYTVALLGVALASWLALRWMDAPVTSRRSDMLLVMAVYLCALGYANHVAGFLPAPALLLVLVLNRRGTLRRSRAVMGAVFAVAIGMSPFVFEPIRAANKPSINEGSPTACIDGPHLNCMLSYETWQRLRGKVGRDQYGGHVVTTRNAPFPVQVELWWRYFRWQWWRDGLLLHPLLQCTLAVTFALLALLGGVAHWRRDRQTFVYVGALMLTMTPGLIYYLNLGYGPTQHAELGASVVREGADRDYFFVWSFASLTLWIGLAMATLWQHGARIVTGLLRRNDGRAVPRETWPRAWVFASPILLAAIIPLMANHRQASRSGQTLARDWAADVLMSLEPYAILITNGDNDTFPLWYAQEVEGMRRDVTVVLAPYLKSDWYVRQLQHAPVHQYRGDGLPAYRMMERMPPHRGLLTLTDAQADAIPQMIDPGNARVFQSGRMRVNLPDGTLTRDQQIVLQLIHDTFPLRPMYFSVGNYAQTLGLGNYLVTQGLLHRLLENKASDASDYVAFPGGFLDVPRSRELWSHYHGMKTLLDEATLVAAIPSDIPTVYDVTVQLLAYGLAQRGDTVAAVTLLNENASLLKALQDLPSAALHPPPRSNER